MVSYKELIENIGLDTEGISSALSLFSSHLSEYIQTVSCSKPIVPASVVFVLDRNALEESDAANIEKINVFVSETPVNEKTIVVKDVVHSLSLFSEYYLAKLELEKILIVGSTGKTATKDFLFSILNEAKPTVRNDYGCSDLIGMLQTSLQIAEDTHFYLQEMELVGPNGTLSHVSNIIRPNICVFTNIGSSHMGNFRNKEHILDNEYRIADYMPENSGIIVLNGDDPCLMERKFRHHSITYGIENRESKYRAANIDSFNDHIDFDLYLEEIFQFRITLNVPGLDNIYPALAAIAVSFELGISTETIQRGLSIFTPTDIRQKILCVDDNTILLDCHGATPESSVSAFDMLSGVKSQGRKIAVLGHMMHLGRFSEMYHREVGKNLAQYHFDEVITFGGMSGLITEEVNNAGGYATHFYDRDEFIKYTKLVIKPGDTILFNGANKFCDFNLLVKDILDKDNQISTPSYWGIDYMNNEFHCDAKAMCLLESDTGILLCGKNLHERLSCSSLLSLLTILLICQKEKLRKIVEIPENVETFSKGYTQINLLPGEKYVLSDLVWLSLHKSASDAIYSMVRSTYNNMRSFWKDMSVLIHALGLCDTHMNDPYGKMDSSNFSSAFDLGLTLAAMIRNPILRELMLSKVRNITEINSSRVSFYNVENQIEVNNVNDEFLLHSPNISVVKEGHNDTSGACICGITENRIAILLGEPDNEYNLSSYIDLKRLLTDIS